jgi:hypothetical protein
VRFVRDQTVALAVGYGDAHLLTLKRCQLLGFDGGVVGEDEQPSGAVMQDQLKPALLHCHNGSGNGRHVMIVLWFREKRPFSVSVPPGQLRRDHTRAVCYGVGSETAGRE